MNLQEALKVINQNLAATIHDNDGANPEYEKEQIYALTMAANALEKQIPKKTIHRRTDEGIVLHKCPSCSDEQLIMQGDNYCFNCGQALDWGDAE